jgi:glutathione S-transferase
MAEKPGGVKMYVLHGVHDWGSQVIHMALAELGVPFRFNALDFGAGDFDAPSFRALNPFGRVPVLETPDGPIFETAAILLYLSEHHDGLAPHSDASDRAQFLIWFIFVTNGLHPAAMLLLHPERPAGEAPQRAVAEATYDLLRSQLAELDGVARTGPWWLSPDRPSILSLYIVMLLRWIKAFPAYADHSIASADFPALHAMAKGLEARPAIRAVLTAEGISGPAFSDPPCETPAD